MHTFNVNGWQFWIIRIDNAQSVPWINRTVHVNNIRRIWFESQIKAIRFIYRIEKIVRIKITPIDVCTLFHKEYQWKAIAKNSIGFVGRLIKAKFIACLISPLNG